MQFKNILMALPIAAIIFAAGLAFAAGSISITSVSIPTSASQGAAFNIIMYVSGSSVTDVTGSLTLPSGITCTPSGTQSISLGVSGTGSATWSCSASVSGDYTGRITASVTAKDSGTGGSLSDSKQTGLTVLSPASLTISSVMSASSISSGGSATYTVGVNNVGDSSTAFSIAIGCPAALSCTPSSVSSTPISGKSLTNKLFTISGSTAGTYTVTATVSSTSQADLLTSKSITVTAAGGSPPGGSNPPGGSSPGSSGTAPGKQEKNATGKIAPPGLVNNTKLQAAIEKVLAKGKMDQNAIDNLVRLSNEISGGTTVSRTISAESSKSTVTTKIKYNGKKVAKNYVVYEKVPKAFANSSANITVSAAGATVEVVEKDPEYAIIFGTVSPNQEMSITYSVNKQVATSVVDSFATEVYADSLVEPTQVCVQVITPAKNPATGECKEYPTPCDVPAGWTKVDSCPAAGDNSGKTPVNQTGTEEKSRMAYYAFLVVIIAAAVYYFVNKSKMRKSKYSF